MLNQKEDLIRLGGIEEEKIDTLSVDMKIQNAIVDELVTELGLCSSKPPNYPYMQLLVRALANVMILDKE